MILGRILQFGGWEVAWDPSPNRQHWQRWITWKKNQEDEGFSIPGESWGPRGCKTQLEAVFDHNLISRKISTLRCVCRLNMFHVISNICKNLPNILWISQLSKFKILRGSSWRKPFVSPTVQCKSCTDRTAVVERRHTGEKLEQKTTAMLVVVEEDRPHTLALSLETCCPQLSYNCQLLNVLGSPSIQHLES